MPNQAYERHKHVFPLFGSLRVEDNQVVTEHDHGGENVSGRHVLILGADGHEYVEDASIKILQSLGWTILDARPKSS